MLTSAASLRNSGKSAPAAMRLLVCSRMIWCNEALFAQREKGFCGRQIGVQPQFRAKLVAGFTIIVLIHQSSAQGDMIAFSRGINGDRAPEKLHGFGQAASAITDHCQIKILPRRRWV